MSRPGSDYQFIADDSPTIEANLTNVYTILTGRAVRAASPERLFIKWVTAAMVQAYTSINIAGNQNIPSRAEGANLDALGELVYTKTRPPASPAGVQMQFTISAPQNSAVLVPRGTRITTTDGSVVFATDEDVYIAIGSTTASVHATCQTAGANGNGYTAGQITTCVDLFPYYESCANTNTSDGGAEIPNDDEYYELMVASEDGYSCAGASGAYAYFAKAVSKEIKDVLVNSPIPGYVYIFTLMSSGLPAGSEIKAAILAACNKDEVRPLTDFVVAYDPEIVNYNIDLTYYIPAETSESAAAIQDAVTAAVDEYVAWQCGKLGRDINPSKLISLLMETGIKRVTVTSPVFTLLRDGNAEDSDPFEEHIPQLAHVGTITLTNGGYEDE